MLDMHEIRDFPVFEDPPSSLIGDTTRFHNLPENSNNLEFMAAVRNYQNALYNRDQNTLKEKIAFADDVTVMRSLRERDFKKSK